MSKSQNASGVMGKLDRFHKTRAGYAVFGFLELGLSLWLANLAIPSGDWWEWLLALICLVGALQNFGRMVVGAKK